MIKINSDYKSYLLEDIQLHTWFRVALQYEEFDKAVYFKTSEFLAILFKYTEHRDKPHVRYNITEANLGAIADKRIFVPLTLTGFELEFDE